MGEQTLPLSFLLLLLLSLFLSLFLPLSVYCARCTVLVPRARSSSSLLGSRGARTVPRDEQLAGTRKLAFTVQWNAIRPFG